MLYTGGGQTRRGASIFDFEAPLSEAVGVSAREAWLFNPLSSLKRTRELTEAQFGTLEDTDDDDDFFSVTPNTEFLERTAPATETLSKDTAQKRIRELGLTLEIPEDGIPEGALNILVERKQAELARQLIRQRSPKGAGPELLKLGTALAVSVADPFNIVASVVPVVGPARYANMVKRATGTLGRAGVRARVGAIEGAVGNALIEPVVYRAANQEQADYTLADSLLAVAFGSVFGAGLHMGGGAIRDAISRGRPWRTAQPVGDTPTRVNSWSPKERAEISRVALAQVLAGKPVDIEPTVALRDAIADFEPASVTDARARIIEKIRTEVQNSLETPGKIDMSAAGKKALESERINLKVKLNSAEKRISKAAQVSQKADGKNARRARQAAKQQITTENDKIKTRLNEIEEILTRSEGAAKAKADLKTLKSGRVPEKYEERVALDTLNLIDSTRRNRLSEAVRGAVEKPNAYIIRAWDRVRESASRRSGDRPSATVDPAAAERIRTQVDENARVSQDVAAAKEELDAELESLQELADILEVDDVTARLSDFDESIKLAESNKKALRAMAVCSFQKGG